MRTGFRIRACGALSIAIVLVGAIGRADAANFKVAFWNIRSGFGSPSLPGHTSTFSLTANCTDPTAALNAWGVGFVQQELVAKIKNDPEVVALGLAEAWDTVCASPANVRAVLGWKSYSEERNGVAIVARYGFAGALQWQQLDTSTAESPADTAWVVRAPVCLDAECSTSMVVYSAHWFAGTVLSAYDIQAQQTATFMGATTSAGQPHVLVGDLNIWEGSVPVCAQPPQNTALTYLRNAGYTDGWPLLFGSVEGYTGMTNRAGCGVPEGYVWKRIDYAWAKAMVPVSMARFGVAPGGDQTPSDHYGVVAEYPWPSSFSDVVSPTVSITAPAGGATVSGVTTVIATAADNVGVARVDLLADGLVTASATSWPYQFAWETTRTTNGVHVLQARAVDAAGNQGSSATRSVTVSNTTPLPTGELVLLADGFSSTSLDPIKWTVTVLSGVQDPSIPIATPNGVLTIGPLKQGLSGSHYNAALSVHPIDLTGGYASVQLVSAPLATTADAMLTLPVDGSNHYRIYLEKGVLSFEQKIAGAKTLVGHLTYDPANHAFWRTRHVLFTDQIAFETAPGIAGTPGPWTTQATIARQLAITGLYVELKAGTSLNESLAPGTVAFDNVRVATTATTVDTTAPTAAISSPAANAVLSGAVTVAVSASDNVGVVSVDLLIDGVVAASDATSPYQFTWDTTQSADGTHVLQARAIDAAGNQGTSATRSVTVSNQTTAETVLLQDAFSAGLDKTKWTLSVFTGTQDTSLPVSVSSGLLWIGPLKQGASGSHYNGVVSMLSVDLSGAYGSVQLVTPPLATTMADAMLTVARDGSYHYRIYLENGVLAFEKKLAGTKTILARVPYSPTAHGFWRIRHAASTDQIVFETAPNNAGAPGAWTAQATVTREFAVTAMYVEVKAGTSMSEAVAPGTVAFDNVRVARP